MGDWFTRGAMESRIKELEALLQEARREHKIDCDDAKRISWQRDSYCVCGADAWNKRIDEVLRG